MSPHKIKLFLPLAILGLVVSLLIPINADVFALTSDQTEINFNVIEAIDDDSDDSSEDEDVPIDPSDDSSDSESAVIDDEDDIAVPNTGDNGLTEGMTIASISALVIILPLLVVVSALFILKKRGITLPRCITKHYYLNNGFSLNKSLVSKKIKQTGLVAILAIGLVGGIALNKVLGNMTSAVDLTLDIETSNEVSAEIERGNQISVTDIVKVNTNADKYSLYVSAGNDNNLHIDSESSDAILTPSDNDEELGDNMWGLVSDLESAGIDAVPLRGNEAIIIKDNTTDEIEVTYTASVSSDQELGTYKGKVYYSVIAESTNTPMTITPSSITGLDGGESVTVTLPIVKAGDMELDVPSIKIGGKDCASPTINTPENQFVTVTCSAPAMDSAATYLVEVDFDGIDYDYTSTDENSITYEEEEEEPETQTYTISASVNDDTYGTIIGNTSFQVNEGTEFSSNGNTITFGSGTEAISLRAEPKSIEGKVVECTGWNPVSGTVTENMNIVVQCGIAGTAEYNISFAVNNNDYGSVNMNSLRLPYGATYTVSSNTITFDVDGETTDVIAEAEELEGYTTTCSGWKIGDSTISSGTITGGTTMIAQCSGTIKSYTVSASVNNTDFGTITGASTLTNIPYGTTYEANGNRMVFSNGAEFVVTPKSVPGYDNITCNTWKPAAGTVTANLTVQAICSGEAQVYYNVTANVNNDNYGKVVPSTLSVLEGTTYTTSGNTITFSDGQTIIATPKTVTGYTTTCNGWKIGNTTTTGGTITTNTTITAQCTGTIKSYTISATVTGGTLNQSSASINYNTTYTVDGNKVTIGSGSSKVEFIATPNDPATGHEAGSCTWKVNGKTVTSGKVTNNMTLAATCTAGPLKTYTVTVGVNNTSYGSVNPNTVSVQYGTNYTTSDNTITFGDGQSIKVTPKDRTGYTTTCNKWSSTSGVVKTNITLTATCERTPNKYLVTASVSGGSLNRSSAEIIYNSSYTVKGDTVTFGAGDNAVKFIVTPNAPAAGHEAGTCTWKIDGKTVTSGNVANDMTLTATCTEGASKTYTITYKSGNGKNATKSFTFSHHGEGTKIKIRALANAQLAGPRYSNVYKLNSEQYKNWTKEGYYFVYWKGSDNKKYIPNVDKNNNLLSSEDMYQNTCKTDGTTGDCIAGYATNADLTLTAVYVKMNSINQAAITLAWAADTNNSEQKLTSGIEMTDDINKIGTADFGTKNWSSMFTLIAPYNKESDGTTAAKRNVYYGYSTPEFKAAAKRYYNYDQIRLAKDAYEAYYYNRADQAAYLRRIWDPEDTAVDPSYSFGRSCDRFVAISTNYALQGISGNPAGGNSVMSVGLTRMPLVMVRNSGYWQAVNTTTDGYRYYQFNYSGSEYIDRTMAQSKSTYRIVDFNGNELPIQDADGEYNVGMTSTMSTSNQGRSELNFLPGDVMFVYRKTGNHDNYVVKYNGERFKIGHTAIYTKTEDGVSHIAEASHYNYRKNDPVYKENGGQLIFASNTYAKAGYFGKLSSGKINFSDTSKVRAIWRYKGA